MLKGIDPRLDADLLHALRAMGHGDTLMLVDANFPAASMATTTTVGRPLSIAAPTLAEAAEAILSVLPLDTFVDDWGGRMEVVDEPETVPEVQRDLLDALARSGESRPLPGIERFAFYDLARAAFAIVRTGERRFYGCAMLRKGVIAPHE